MRMNSDPDGRKTAPLTFDQQSIFISGNLRRNEGVVEELFSDDDIEWDLDDEGLAAKETTLDDETNYVKKADDILMKGFGIRVLETAAKCLVNGKINQDDMVIQALAYLCQKLLRGKKGIRYHESWGLWWCGVRTLIKGRGLVPFLDHFELPAKLSKYRPKILDICGLKPETLGKSGLQVQNTNLWLSGKKSEIGEDSFCLSLSFDGKKISVTSGGHEDMGGVGDSEVKSQLDMNHENEKQTFLNLLTKNNRESLYQLFDELSLSAKCIVKKLDALEKLSNKNKRQMEKNPNLAKYIFILQQQSATGIMLLNNLGKLQFEIGRIVSSLRSSLHLLRENSSFLDLGTQPNYYRLQIMSDQADNRISECIENLRNSISIVNFPWAELGNILTRPLEKIPRNSKSFRSLEQSCYIQASQTFEACGLGSVRPLQDMKSIYEQVHKSSLGLTASGVNSRAIASFTSTFASMSFGNNCVVADSGLYCNEGIGALPDLTVLDKSGQLEYIVLFNEVGTDTFAVSDQVITTCIVSCQVCKPSKGCLLVQLSQSSMVIFTVVLVKEFVKSMKSFLKSYIQNPACVKKRSAWQLDQISGMRAELAQISTKLTPIGSYPLVEIVENTWIETEEDVFPGHLVGSKSRYPVKFVKQDLSEELLAFLDDLRKYLAKQARELIVCNISDMSGNPSKYPHTVFGATFLSSASLKTVIKDCINETRNMIEVHPSSSQVLNISCDGESLHLVTRTKEGKPGTLIALSKHLFDLTKSIKKQELSRITAMNPNICLPEDTTFIEEIEEDSVPHPAGDITEYLNDAVANIMNESEVRSCSLDDIEILLTDGDSIVHEADPKRVEKC